MSRPKCPRGLGGGWSQSVAELLGALWGYTTTIISTTTSASATTVTAVATFYYQYL